MQETAAIIWGAISALICFGIGGYIAGLGSVGADRSWKMINGFMVWAVAIPIMVFWLGSSRGPMLGRSATNDAGSTDAVQAGARMGSDNVSNIPPVTVPGEATTHTRAAAWWLLVSLVLGLVGAAGMGYASGDDRFGRGGSGRTSPPDRPVVP